MTTVEHERVLSPDPAEREEIDALSDFMEAVDAARRETARAQRQTAKLVGPDGFFAK